MGVGARAGSAGFIRLGRMDWGVRGDIAHRLPKQAEILGSRGAQG